MLGEAKTKHKYCTLDKQNLSNNKFTNYYLNIMHHYGKQQKHQYHQQHQGQKQQQG